MRAITNHACGCQRVWLCVRRRALDHAQLRATARAASRCVPIPSMGSPSYRRSVSAPVHPTLIPRRDSSTACKPMRAGTLSTLVLRTFRAIELPGLLVAARSERRPTGRNELSRNARVRCVLPRLSADNSRPPDLCSSILPRALLTHFPRPLTPLVRASASHC